MTTEDPGREPTGSRIIGKHYFTATVPKVNWPVMVVARAGVVDDWAAYVMGLGTLGEPTPEHEQMVADCGIKLTERQARGFFPDVTLRYRE